MVDRTGAVLTSHPACWGSLHEPSHVMLGMRGVISSTGSSQVLTSEAFVMQSDQHEESFFTLHDQDVRSCSFSRQPCGKGTAHARPDFCTKRRHCPVAAQSTRAAPRSLCDLSPP